MDTFRSILKFRSEKTFDRQPGRFRLSEGGWTLIEMMVVLALMGIVIPAVTMLFMKVRQAYASDEMHLQLKSANEHAQLRVHERLLQNVHMFQNNASGLGFKAVVGLTASDPPTIAGSKLPLAQPSTIMSFSPAAGSVPADFGNSLLFAAFDFPQTFPAPGGAKVYTAPLTVYGPATNNAYSPPVTITNSVRFSAANGGGPATVILDVYRFYYYYLTTNDKALPNVASYRLCEWESAQYADASEINNITDGTVQAAVINWLINSPANFPGGPITLAYDPTESTAANAFFSLSGGAMNSITANIVRADSTIVSQVSSGILTSGFFYGVCGNTAGWYLAPSAKVPLYAAASGNFPGGFEVGIVGSGAGMQVLTRMMLVAQGASPQAVWYDNSSISSVKDLW